ncbi:NgoFVII family restriction endonuclease [Pseudidiomarina gelatinasegens]|uniref:NgoFVII family restriction endonuclease n=1 Tax=Pseudidiomarina gelatinasegens TaxID=2487740 RepID=A0A443YVP5_9GAMM|nr:phospholipase D family protein [Pseudidiomarina gelatinasegens]RWU08036.1 NgoFVII family restriction endonuclease [Pseudidiomarina gelatinasegens]|tara:strand:- start:3792 stop:4418 length:627 start_codon:yes stop_codon:yes gene_type:complete
MLAIAIILRNQLPVNRFRDLLIGSIQTGAGDNALLCSGFFQENFKGSAYQASAERNFGLEVARSKIELNTVGVHNGSWKQSYRDFRDNMKALGANINCYYKNGLKWHAKVFVLSKGAEPVFGIIGSSNITRTAFGSQSNFNYECDVMIWPDENKKISAWVDNQMADNNFPYELIRAPYDPDMNNGIAVKDRLQKLKTEIFDSSLSKLN